MNTNPRQWDALLASCFSTPGMPCGREYTEPVTTLVWREWATQDWSGERAFRKLGVKLVEFHPLFWLTRGAMGCTTDEGIGLCPMTAPAGRVRTIAHELGHWLLRHVNARRMANGEPEMLERAPIQEIEADAVALLVCFALGVPVDDCRFYMQQQAQRPLDGPLPQSWERVRQAATTILTAGAWTAPPEASAGPKRVLGVADMRFNFGK